MVTRRKKVKILSHKQIHERLIHLGYIWDILDQLRRSIASAGEIRSICAMITEKISLDAERVLFDSIEEEFSRKYKIILSLFYEKTYDYLSQRLQDYFLAHPQEIWIVTGHDRKGNILSQRGKPSGLMHGVNNEPCLAYYEAEGIFPLDRLEDIRFDKHLVKIPRADWLEKTST